MLVQGLMLALALAGCVLGAAQLETGVLAGLYYPPVPRAPTSSTVPPYARWTRARALPARARAARRKRSHFDREEGASEESNDALLQRLRSNMTDPDWTPDVGPRATRSL